MRKVKIWARDHKPSLNDHKPTITILPIFLLFHKKNLSFPQKKSSFPQSFDSTSTQCTDGHGDRLIPNMGGDHPISRPFSEPFPRRFSGHISKPNYISQNISKNLYLRYVLLYFISVMFPLFISDFTRFLNPFTFAPFIMPHSYDPFRFAPYLFSFRVLEGTRKFDLFG